MHCDGIKIIVTHGLSYIWNADDWLKLRRDHRIIGCFDGAQGEGWTRPVHVNLPFKLSSIEARYAVDQGIAQAYQVPELMKIRQPVSQEEYDDRLKVQEAKQLEIQKEKKRKEIEATVDKIIEGKRRKGKEVSDDKEAVIEAELERFKELPIKTVRFDLIDPWTADSNLIHYTFPELTSAKEKLRYQVFCDFHSKMKYYLTTGIKFGGDFIAYPGDPLHFHAEYIIMCEDNQRSYTDTHLRSQCRLATTLKKTLLVASLDDKTGNVNYRRITRPQMEDCEELNK